MSETMRWWWASTDLHLNRRNEVRMKAQENGYIFSNTTYSAICLYISAVLKHD